MATADHPIASPKHRTLKQRLRRFLAWVRKTVPEWLRLPLGILLMLLGLLGFLPILGFWMIPVGFAVAAMGMRPIRARLNKRRRG